MDRPTYTETHVRQSDAIPEAFLGKSVSIIGLGGIGSPTAFLLAKMGIENLTIVDFDKVDVHNISSQLYGLDDVDKYKAIALRERIKNELGVEVTAVTEKCDDLPDSDIVILAVDSMDTRIELYKTVKSQYLIDARMGLEFLRIYCFSPFDSELSDQYEKNLYPSSEAEELPCTARAVGYNTFFIGSLIVSLVKKIIVSERLPFEIIADLSNYYLKTFTGRTRRKSGNLRGNTQIG